MSIQIEMEENAAFAKEIDRRLLAYNQEHSDQFKGKWRPARPPGHAPSGDGAYGVLS